MYICTVMCCAVGTTDQAADLEQCDVCSYTRGGFCAAQSFRNTGDDGE